MPRDASTPAPRGRVGKRVPNPANLQRTPMERSAARIDRSSFVRISSKSGEQMKVQVRDGIPVDLVVHLHGTEQSGQGPCRGHCVLPERSSLRGGQLERFNHMALRDHTDVPGERRGFRSRHPGACRFGNQVRRSHLSTQRAPGTVEKVRPPLPVVPRGLRDSRNDLH